MRARLLLLILLAGCGDDGLSTLAGNEQFRISIVVPQDGNSFSVTVSTSGSHGCDAAVGVRSGRNSGTVFIEALGITAGDSGCPGTPARSRPVSFSNITNRVMTFELWFDGRVDRYQMQADANRRWTLTSLNQQFSNAGLTQN